MMKYFTLRELTRTRTGLSNDPPAEVVARLEQLVAEVLDPLRTAYGGPIRVTSGYRSPEVNRAIGGSLRSQHLRGEAADITCRDMAWCFAYIRAHLPYDQLIWEFGDDRQPEWIHVSIAREGRPPRAEALRAVRSPHGQTSYVPMPLGAEGGAFGGGF